MARPLGKNQIGFLEALGEHGSYPGSGWCWGSPSEGEKLAKSLWKRGLTIQVDRVVETPFGRRVTVKRWVLTPEGERVLAETSPGYAKRRLGRDLQRAIFDAQAVGLSTEDIRSSIETTILRTGLQKEKGG